MSRTKMTLLALTLLALSGGRTLSASALQLGQAALLKAVGEGRVDLVQELLALGIDPNAKGEDGWTPLMSAAQRGHTEVVNALLESGADVNAKMSNGLTALMAAARGGDAEAVNALLERGADVNAETQDGWSAWMWAARNRHRDVVQLLKEAGASYSGVRATAVAILRDAGVLTERGRIPDAVQAYARAQAFDSTLVRASHWSVLCWFGSMWGSAADVMTACERAVALAPDDGGVRDNRGMARALTADTEGAIADFEAFVAWTESDSARTRRRGWIDALRAGKNPFTTELLDSLRLELRLLDDPPERISSPTLVYTRLLDDPPERISSPNLDYPRQLQRSCIQGWVLLKAVVDTRGRIEPASIRVVRSTHSGFERAAKDFLRKVRYTPGQWGGRPVRALIYMPIQFSLQGC